MSRRILVCSIMRNQIGSLSSWYTQLGSVINQCTKEGWEFEVSVYENDSTDLTGPNAEGLLHCFPRSVAKVHFRSEILGTQQYGSIWSVDRLRNLANARQACLDQVGDLSRFDKIAFIEPDVIYDPEWCKELILARHPAAAGLGDPDIYSGWSLRTEKHPKESVFLYDTCATRATENDIVWDVSEQCGKWRGASLIPTYLGLTDSNCLHRVWSTFNCFCVYNARPFIEGLRWDYVNERIDTKQTNVVSELTGKRGALDADTSVMCEAFRVKGFAKIYLNTNCLIRHA